MQGFTILQVLADKTSVALLVREGNGIVNGVYLIIELAYLLLSILIILQVGLAIRRFRANQLMRQLLRWCFAALTLISSLVSSFFAAGFYCFIVSDFSKAEMISSEVNFRWQLFEILFVWSCVGILWLAGEIVNYIWGHKLAVDCKSTTASQAAPAKLGL